MRTRAWWKEGVVYQLYPRSFMDSNGDGIGDLRGIIAQLDYLKWLGVDIVWLNPVYRSPDHDNGYDVSDYEAISPEFGSFEDWCALRDGMHARGMRLVMDLVVNHSSHEHPWFVESRSSRNAAKRDWYYWRPGKDGGPPNSWRAVFGGPAWNLDPATGEYYLGVFSPYQPDLNWNNPVVREEVFALMRRWLDRGVDGFRMDVISMIGKDPAWTDGDPDPGQSAPEPAFTNRPEAHRWLQDMWREVLDGRDVMTVGECPAAKPEDAVLFTDPARKELNMVFQFEHVGLEHVGSKWNTRLLQLLELKASISRWQHALDQKGWNSLYLMNHDQPRTVSRFGNDSVWRVESAKLLITLNLTLQGTPYIYQGEEIGMRNCKFEAISDYRDLESLNFAESALAEGRPEAEILSRLHAMSRDNSRTPMQWNTRPNAGFTTGKPWIGINPDYTEINVEAAQADPDSVLHYVRAMIRFRSANPTLIYGSYEEVDEVNPFVFAYLRKDEEAEFLVALHFGQGFASLTLPVGLDRDRLEPAFGNYASGTDAAVLRDWEAAIWRIRPAG